MPDILEQYGRLLGEVDGWFSACLRDNADLISCRQGCGACCRGLFDITLLDALYLRRGFERLPLPLREPVRRKALLRLQDVSRQWPSFRDPWLLAAIPEAEWGRVMPEGDPTPCVLLSEEGNCLVYDHRPMTCRLHGIPPIDCDGEEFFDEWCSLNFVACDPRDLPGLRYPFRELFARELLLFRGLTERIFGEPLHELDTLIPAALCMDTAVLGAALGFRPEGTRAG